MSVGVGECTCCLRARHALKRRTSAGLGRKDAGHGRQRTSQSMRIARIFSLMCGWRLM